MIDLIDGLKHEKSGQVFLKELRKLFALYIPILLFYMLGIGLYRGSIDKVFTADVLAVIFVIGLVWIKDALSEICNLSDIHRNEK